nr:hypothetical protein [Phenylobacterium sp.]
MTRSSRGGGELAYPLGRAAAVARARGASGEAAIISESPRMLSEHTQSSGSTGLRAEPVPLREPRSLPRRRGRDLAVGLTLLPAQRLQAFSDEQLEMVVEHWLYEPCEEIYPDVVDGLENEGGVPSRLMKTDAGDGRQEGTPCRMFAAPHRGER